MERSPYRFLDYYKVEDRDIFFGREREIETLLSEVVVNRLVVLFAKTGTGKTSLINAGVRPRLKDLGYKALYLRVEKDPAEDVREALREENLLPSKFEGESLATQLEQAVTKLGKPIVLFFDQFEEFFIHISGDEDRHRFISDIAEVYHNRESGVHIVFSMREEFLHEMDDFRDEIPSIFHKDSNLRLRWFDKDQAREAIVGPLQRSEFETEIENDLVEDLIRDLAEGGRIEPTRLQIVCDTLWRERADRRILLADYERLGGAEQILNRRLEEDIGKKLKPGQLRLFEKLLPELTTERDTKYVRGFDELVKTLETDAASLRKLVDQLRKLRLLRESTHYGALYIEWTSDYLAERTDYLQKRLRAISLRRLLEDAIDKAKSKTADLAGQESLTDTPWIEAPTEDDLEALYMASVDFEAISEGADLLGDLGQAEAEFLFVAALEHGTHMRLWFWKASQSGVEVWQILKDRIEYGEAQFRQVKNAIQLLGELRDEQAMELLEVALQQPALSSITLEVLGEMRTVEAITLLERALQQDALASEAIDVLRRMRTTEAINLLEMTLRQEGAFALQAGMALNRIASGRPSRASSQAGEVLADVLAERAEPLFLQALEQRLDMRFWFEKAAENGVDVWGILRENIVNRDVPIEQAQNTVRLLGTLGTGRALKLLETALQEDTLAGLTLTILGQMETKEVVEFWEPMLQQEHLVSEAQRALGKISESRTAEAEAKDRARGVLDKWRQDQGIAQPRIAPMVERERLPTVSRGLEERDWELFLWRIKDGKCTPFLGAGVNYGVLPHGSAIAQQWVQEYQYPLEDFSDLARVAQFLAVRYDPMFPKEILERFYKNVEAPDFTEPDEPHSVLADLPLPIYMTTNYDDFMVQALKSREKSPKRELCRWNQLLKDRPSIFELEPGFRPTVANPVVFHFHGLDKVPESLVLTEDDYLDFLVNISRDLDLLPPRIQEALTGTSLLFIGYRVTDWSFRVLFQGLIAPTAESSLRRINVILQEPTMLTDAPESTQRQVLKYLDQYFEKFNIRVYWGTAREFAAELRQRWEYFSNDT